MKRPHRPVRDPCPVLVVALLVITAALLFAVVSAWRQGGVDRGVGSLSAPISMSVGGKLMPAEVNFLSFEPWNGGWNNRRMSLELAFTIALLTNRTLVLPPRSTVALIPGVESCYEDFFNITTMREYLPVLTWEEFLPLVPYLTPSAGAGKAPSSCTYKMPNPRRFCQLALPVRERAKLVAWDTLRTVIPVPEEVPPSLTSDLKEFAPRQKPLGLSSLDGERLVHFPQNLFGLFYQIFYIHHVPTRRRVYRAVRDGLSFTLPLRDAAHRVVKKLGGAGKYSCIHVRRRDFKSQYRHAYLEATTVAVNINNQVGNTVYVMSDESDPSFWKDLAEGLPKVKSLLRFSDVKEALGDVPKAWLGVVEQLVCSKADIFIGTRYSTFSSYVTRLRGYDATVKNKNVYFTDTQYDKRRPDIPEDRPYSWSKKWLRAPWAREYKEAWHGIDEE